MPEPDFNRLQAAHKKLKVDPQFAIRELETLSALGSAMAPLYLGWTYKAGDGVVKSQDRAEHWLKLSFERGEIQASYYLGHFYSERAQHQEANSAFERGAALGYTPSTYCLAMNLLEGKPPPKDINRAKNLLLAASNEGHVFAQRSLASLYLSGQFGYLKVGYGFESSGLKSRPGSCRYALVA